MASWVLLFPVITNYNRIMFQSLLDKLKITFRNQILLETAFTHRSYLNEAGKNRQSNERLEFLGDSILSFLISQYLYQKFPHEPEGLLTNLRSSVVKTESLAQVAQNLNLGRYLLLSKGEEKGGGRKNISLLADTFEAFLAAIFLDQGLAVTTKFLEIYLYPKIPQILSDETFNDYKSKLQEIVQTTSQEPPSYKVVKTTGPDHAKQFWVVVVFDGKTQETGEGKSKQEAEQEAAHKTLVKMGQI